jgi:hypothetical protein
VSGAKVFADAPGGFPLAIDCKAYQRVLSLSLVDSYFKTAFYDPKLRFENI